ncbi:hypothetical protein H0H87_010824 [Tephrocybe sp. NHM501043]|nr:hypothetical protein H0H87_010824 [Tephrocybe sp. NHM501043]
MGRRNKFKEQIRDKMTLVTCVTRRDKFFEIIANSWSMESSMSSTTSTHTSPSQISSSTITIPTRPRLLKKPAKPTTPPHVDIPVPSVVAVRKRVRDFPRLSPETPSLASSSQLKTSATKSPRKSKPVPCDSWDLSKLGKKVWVLIDTHARVLHPDDLEKIESQNKDRIWWPGKVAITSTTVDERPLRVLLANPSGFPVESIEISEPCSANILSWTGHKGDIRFEEPAFTNPSSFVDIHLSPRKRQKVDRSGMENRWRVAVDEVKNFSTTISAPPKNAPISLKKGSSSTKGPAVQPSMFFPEPDDDSYESDLPDIGTEAFRTFTHSAPPSPVKNAKMATSSQRKRKRAASVENDTGEELASRPPPLPEDSPDPSIDIPGELILAIERAGDTLYWPAKVLEYVPSTKGRGKYQVVFLDGKQRAIPRRWFYIAEDDGFATCKLGLWESTVVEVQNDDDKEDNDELDSRRRRSPSPMPSHPPPSADEFRQLDIRQQLAYTKPVLSAILNANFSPAMRRHLGFVAGGVKRKGIVEEASLRGQMDPSDVESLQRYVTDWCLRGEQRAQAIIDEDDIILLSQQEKAGPGGDIFGATAVPFPRPPSPTPSEATDILCDAELPPTSSFTTSQATSSFYSIDSRSSASPRQYGCEAFESLSQPEKNDYCLNVLVPEAILQILLWREGERTSIKILDDLDETILYKKGLELLRASDWVNDVMRLRQALVGQLGKSRKNDGGKSKNKSKPDDEVWYTETGRPRRSAMTKKSYHE